MTYSGALLAYAVSGFLADRIFNPSFMPGGLFANNLGHIFGVGAGRGIAFMFFCFWCACYGRWQYLFLNPNLFGN